MAGPAHTPLGVPHAVLGPCCRWQAQHAHTPWVCPTRSWILAAVCLCVLVSVIGVGLHCSQPSGVPWWRLLPLRPSCDLWEEVGWTLGRGHSGQHPACLCALSSLGVRLRALSGLGSPTGDPTPFPRTSYFLVGRVTALNPSVHLPGPGASGSSGRSCVGLVAFP